MATYTTFLQLEKPTTSERLDVLKINANWDKVDAGVKALAICSDIGNDSLANIQNALVTLGASMADNQTKPIKFIVTPSSGLFAETAYIGNIQRITSSRLTINVRQCVWSNVSIVGNYKDGSWSWAQLACNDAVYPSLSEWGVRRITYHTPTNPPGAVDGMTLSIANDQYLWGTFTIYTRFGIHTFIFATNSTNGIHIAEVHTTHAVSNETLTITVSNRTATIKSNQPYNYFALEGFSSQSPSAFNFNYTTTT